MWKVALGHPAKVGRVNPNPNPTFAGCPSANSNYVSSYTLTTY